MKLKSNFTSIRIERDFNIEIKNNFEFWLAKELYNRNINITWILESKLYFKFGIEMECLHQVEQTCTTEIQTKH